MSKTILLIGSSGGLGKEISTYLSQKGHTLALHYFKNKPANATFNKCYQADISDEDQVKKMIEQVINDHGKIDAVIHNAGISKSEMSWKTSMENWNQTIGVNLTGPFLVSKHLLPHFRENKQGRIIFISSIVAQTGFIGTSAYSASKAGLIGLTKTLAKESASKNITVNAIAPGYFSAGMIHDVSAEIQEELKTTIPAGRLGKPSELSALLDYILSDEANYLTGQVISLNGGLMM